MTISFILLVVGCVLTLPIAYSVGVAALAGLAVCGFPLQLVAQRMFTQTDSFSLMAIPFFLLAGNLMDFGGMSKRLVNLSSQLVGHIRGGLAQINVLDSLFFGGISGSAVADTSGIGSMIIPQMIRKGYTPEFTVAITATTSVLGQIIPPSLIMIIYAATANTSVQAMFLAGIIPGCLFALTMMVVSYLCSLPG